MIPELLRWWKQPYSIYLWILFFTCNFNTAIWSFIHVYYYYYYSTIPNFDDRESCRYIAITIHYYYSSKENCVWTVCEKMMHMHRSSKRKPATRKEKRENSFSFFNRSQLLFFFSSPYYENDSVFKAAVHGELFPRTLLQRCCLRQSQKWPFSKPAYDFLLAISNFALLKIKLPSDSWCLMNGTYFCSSVPLLSKSTKQDIKTATKQLLLV